MRIRSLGSSSRGIFGKSIFQSTTMRRRCKSSLNLNWGEYAKKSLGLIKYVGFIKDEKIKIQRVLSVLPSFYKEKI